MKRTNIADGLTKVGSKAAQVASNASIKAAKAASSGLKKAGDMAQQAHHDRRMARLNPLFPSEYNDPEFDLPNLIVIVDEDQRKNIPECAGAIGWMSEDTDLEVLNLYFEAVPSSGLSFYPPATIGAAYYRDTFDSKHFINLEAFSSVVQKDKMTELRDIAFALGAKACKLESYESTRTIRSEKKKGTAKAKLPAGNVNASADSTRRKETSEERSVRFEQVFEGDRKPIAPELKWFAHDREIESLINMVLSGSRLPEYRIKLDSSASCSMSRQLAGKVDASLKKLKASGNFSMEGEVSTEARQVLEFSIEF